MPNILALQTDAGVQIGKFALSDQEAQQVVSYIRGLQKQKKANAPSAQPEGPMPPNQPRYPQQQLPLFGQHENTPVAPGQLRPVEVPIAGPGSEGVRSNLPGESRFHNPKFRRAPTR